MKFLLVINIIIILLLFCFILIFYDNTYFLFISFILYLIIAFILLFNPSLSHSVILGGFKKYKLSNSFSIKSLPITHNKVPQFLLSRFPTIKQFFNFYVKENSNNLHSNVSSLPEISYHPDLNIINFNCHLGQRKLLLTEIEFYSKFSNHLDNTLVIYAGSASSEHHPIISKLFPKLKFILIDPNFHSLGSDIISNTDYEYIYQNLDVIDPSNASLFKKHLSSTSPRHKLLNISSNSLLNVKFLFDKTNNLYPVLHDISIQKTNPSLYKNIISFQKSFYTNHSMDLIQTIMDHDKSIFIIQDYFSQNLAAKIKSSIDQFNSSQSPLNMIFLTDIRTSLFDGNLSFPSDIDILWNSALQIIFLKILQPDWSMLKFRTPFFYNVDSKKIQNFINNFSDYPNNKNTISPLHSSFYQDFLFVKNSYNLDLLSNFNNHRFFYFNSSNIYLQPWAPISSSESRLFVSLSNINDNFVLYDHHIWENKFMYFTLLRNYKIHSLFDNFIINQSTSHYNRCYDCSRELFILGQYFLLKYDKLSHLSDDLLLSKIKQYVNHSDHFQEITDIYSDITQITFFDLSAHNYKCKFHHLFDSSNTNQLSINFINYKLNYIYGLSLSNDFSSLNVNNISYLYKYHSNTHITKKNIVKYLSIFKPLFVDSHLWNLQLKNK